MDDGQDQEIERSIQFAGRLIMGGKMEPQAIQVAIMRRGFNAEEAAVIIKAAIGRIEAYQKNTTKHYDGQLAKIGGLMIFAWLAVVTLVGYPEHGRGIGLLNTLLLFGIGTLGYGIYGRMTARR